MGVRADGEGTPARLPHGPHQLSAEEVSANQRTRLIDALVELVGLQGYTGTSVTDVLERAGISRRSFYELFSNRAQLLKAAFEVSAASILERVEASSERSGAGGARQLEALMRPLCSSAQEEPGTIALWSVEIAADPDGYRLRDGLMNRYAELIQGALGTNGHPPMRRSLAATLAGAMHRTIDATMRDTRADVLPDLPSLLARWASSYHPLPADLELAPARPWRSIEPDGLIGGRAPGTLTSAPEAYVPRIGKSSSGFRAHANRERILDAVAQITAESGFAALGGQAILARAKVPENVFRGEFKNARGAFVAALELGHMKGQAVVERTRAETSSWSEGVRYAVHGLLEFFASEPCFTRLAFIDAPLAWPMTAARANEQATIYARLMFEGAPQRRRPGPIADVAITHGLIELAYRYAATNRVGELPRAAAEATYLALAPFIGVDEAAETAAAPL